MLKFRVGQWRQTFMKLEAVAQAVPGNVQKTKNRRRINSKLGQYRIVLGTVHEGICHV
jgi:hypothetical protein